jgi:FkbM family methyltransferase
MDQWWQEVADFVAARGLAGKGIVAPIEFSPAIPIDIGYANAGAYEAAQTTALVLHKGRYEELDRGFMKLVMARLRPVFANEVFIVLADAGEPLPDDHPHTGHLREIRAWLESGGEPPGPPKQRMAATYMGNDVVLAETIHGHLMLLPAGDRAITPHIIRDGYFDLGLTRFLERFLRPGMIYVDVGANIGVYALLAARSVGATGRVVAIEALPRLQAVLVDNFSMNGMLDHAHVLPFAAADQEGQLGFYDFGRHDGASTAVDRVALLQEQRLLDTPRRLLVPSRTLSTLLREANVSRADLIKIDVEGFEWEVLQGARDFLTAQRDTGLVLEWHSEFMPAAGQERLYAMLVEELHCQLERIEPDGSTTSVGFDALRRVGHADIFARGRLSLE